MGARENRVHPITNRSTRHVAETLRLPQDRAHHEHRPFNSSPTCSGRSPKPENTPCGTRTDRIESPPAWAKAHPTPHVQAAPTNSRGLSSLSRNHTGVKPLTVDEARLLPRLRASVQLEVYKQHKHHAWVLQQSLPENPQPLRPRHSHSKPGDPLQLRGIPAIGRSVAGEIRETQPEKETVRRVTQRENVNSRAA